MEDIRLGRETSSITRIAQTGNAASALLAPADPRRIALAIGICESQTVHIGPRSVTLAAGVGYRLTAGIPPLFMTLETHGRQVCEQWNGFGVGAAVNMMITEVTLEKE